MVLILLVAFCTIVACDSAPPLAPRAASIGERLLETGVSGRAGELSATRDFPDVVWIGPQLAQKLDSLAPLERIQCSVKVHAEDQLKDPEASHHLILVCDQSAQLGIRLRFDDALNMFHILGFWTPFAARQIPSTIDPVKFS